MTTHDDSDSRAYPATPLLCASAAVFRDGLVLVAKRGQEPLKGIWSLPGGLVEPGETLTEAATRELREETSVSAEMIAPADITEVIRHDEAGLVVRHYVIVCFAARWLSGEALITEEATEVAWMARDALSDLTMTDSAPRIIAKAAEIVIAAATD